MNRLEKLWAINQLTPVSNYFGWMPLFMKSRRISNRTNRNFNAADGLYLASSDMFTSHKTVQS